MTMSTTRFKTRRASHAAQEASSRRSSSSPLANVSRPGCGRPVVLGLDTANAERRPTRPARRTAISCFSQHSRTVKLLTAIGVLLLVAGCSGVAELLNAPTDTASVVSADRDALWDATYSALSRQGTIGGADKEEGYLAIEPKSREWRSGGPHGMPATAYSMERAEARIRPRGDGRYAVRVQVHEQQTVPHKFRLYRGDTKESRPEARVQSVNHATASTRSRMLEKMILEDIAQELELRGSGTD